MPSSAAVDASDARAMVQRGRRYSTRVRFAEPGGWESTLAATRVEFESGVGEEKEP